MDWIHSCRVVVSTDSLGLHLGLAMDKWVVGLFGPTDPSEIHGYGRWRCVRAPSGAGMDRLCLEEAVAAVGELYPCP
jgi:heptosyltransferase-2